MSEVIGILEDARRRSLGNFYLLCLLGALSNSIRYTLFESVDLIPFSTEEESDQPI